MAAIRCGGRRGDGHHDKLTSRTKCPRGQGLERERHFVAHLAMQRDRHFVREVVAALGAATTLPGDSGQRQNVADQTAKPEKNSYNNTVQHTSGCTVLSYLIRDIFSDVL
ncbi:MAG: hypothetical protein E7425_02710 [Ruminococcaceae bacterium]|nr:hypothetical protein [Oscillospiraceae bacterium]